ncbi:MAG: nuclear transport factor 2 family protein [Acidimicrobiales bacterium]
MNEQAAPRDQAAPESIGRLVWEHEQRREITETLLDYCELVDRNDPAGLVERVFAPDGAFELGSNRAVVGRDNLAKMFAKTLAAFSATSHHLSNVRVTFSGTAGQNADRAHATAFVYAWHRTVGGERVEVWGRYADTLVRTEAGWRIESRRATTAGADGWANAPFEFIDRLPNPTDTPSPEVQRR